MTDEIIIRRFRVERHLRGWIERIYIENLNPRSRGCPWRLLWTRKQAGNVRYKDLDIEKILQVEFTVEALDIEALPSSEKYLLSTQ